MTIGTPNTACQTIQNDASSGADISDEMSSAFDLGTDPVVEHRGCVDENDEKDVYKVTVTAGQELNVTLVTAPIDGADFDLRLVAANGTSIDSSLSSTSDEFVSLFDTDLAGVAGDYYLNITYFGGFGTPASPGGTYRLLIGQPDQSTYVPPFDCGSQNDLGQGVGQDADASGIRPWDQ